MPVNRDGGNWDGGYISLGRGGRKTFFIERSVNGVRFHVSTRCHNETAAYAQLKRFESDPAAYDPAGVGGAVPLAITDELILKFHRWSTVEKRNTERHAREMGRLLADWMVAFNGADLRKVTIPDHIKPALDGWGAARQHRIIALKSFYAWLRKVEHKLTHRDDPTLEDLPVPQGRPEKNRRHKAVAFEQVRAVLEKLEPRYRDMLLVMGNTGMHVTEFERFVRDEDSHIVEATRGKTIAALLVWHKVKKWHPYPVTSQAALDAAKRSRAMGTVPRKHNDTLKAACREAGVAEFTFGKMRHSVSTWLDELGGESWRLLGHASAETTQRFYNHNVVPFLAVAPPALKEGA